MTTDEKLDSLIEGQRALLQMLDYLVQALAQEEDDNPQPLSDLDGNAY